MAKSNLFGKDKTIKPHNIYLDYASSALPNPSSIHASGVQAKKKLEKARREIASALGARPEEIIFTSGGTEGNNLAIQGAVFAFWSAQAGREKKEGKSLPHIITTNIEHPSVLETYRLLERRKLAQVSIVEVGPDGIVDPLKIKKEIKKNTILISVMYANNEIGTIQPVREIAKVIRYYRKINTTNLPLFHTDAVQAVNYLELNVERLGVDMLTLSGTKVEGSGRVGILYKKSSAQIENVFAGGDQEGGLRPGTENLFEILKFAHAFKNARSISGKESDRLRKLQEYFIEKLRNFNLVLNGNSGNRLPNILNFTIPGIPSDLLVIELSAKGVMASSKSACKSGDGKASHVIKAINKNISDTDGSIRFSLGRQTKKNDIDYSVRALSEILTKLKKWYN